MVLTRAFLCRTLYKLLGSTIIDGCNNYIVLKSETEEDRVPTISIENIILWHQILGHIGDKGFLALQGKGMVEGMSISTLNFDFSEHCLYGKKNRVRFSCSASRDKGILDLIHCDVFGPVHVPSLGGSLYYFPFIDNFSRNT